MKKILTALFCLTASICFCVENLIVNPNGENEFKGFWKSPRAGIVSKHPRAAPKQTKQAPQTPVRKF